MNPMDFDSLILNNQGFNTMDNLANSNTVQNMTQATLQNIQSMQTPVQQGFLPQHVVIPAFQDKLKNNAAPASAQNSHQFFAVVNGAQKGPFTLEQLKGLAIADVINEDSLVWMQGMPEWVALKICLANLK
jgi:hypothetical protein